MMMNDIHAISSCSDTDLLDSYISYRRRYDLLQGDESVNLDAYKTEIAAYQDEYVNRGNTLDMLSSDAGARIASLLATDVNDLTDDEVSLRFLCDTGKGTQAKIVAKALDQNPEDVGAANQAAGGREALTADVNIRSIEDVPVEEQQQASPVWQFIDQAAMNIGQSWLLSKVTRLFGGSTMASMLIGAGGRQLLSGVGVLPNSIAPILELVKPLLPEQAQKGLDSVIDSLQPKSEEQLEEERTSKYSSLALGDSMAQSIDAAGEYTAESIHDAMYANGQVIGGSDVMVHVGEHGPEEATSVRDMVVLSNVAAETGFDERIAAGEDCSEDMRYYYMSLFSGLAGYNEGVIDGAYELYGPDSPELAATGVGLGYVNGQYCSAAMASLRRYDAEYHFMTEEDWATLDSYNFIGVGPLSTYEPEYAIDTEAIVQAHAEDTAQEEASAETPTEESEVPETQAEEDPAQSLETADDKTVDKKDEPSKKLEKKEEAVEETPVKKEGQADTKESPKEDKHDERVKQAEALEQQVAGAPKQSKLGITMDR